MRYQKFKEKSQWLGLMTGILFLTVNIYLRVKHVFDNGNFAGTLTLLAYIFALLTLVFGFVSFPSWQSIIS